MVIVEKTLLLSAADRFERIPVIYTSTRCCEGIGVYICSEQFPGPLVPCLVLQLGYQDRERIHLFSGGTPRTPDAKLVLVTLQKVRKNGFRDDPEHICVAKELRHPDQEITRKLLSLICRVAQQFDILIDA